MTKLEEFKDMIHWGMTENFKKDGYLAPMLFIMKNGEVLASLIPPDFMQDLISKEILASLIKNMCADPMVLAMGLVFDAYASKIDKDTELAEKVLNGEIRVSELDSKYDIILSVISTREGEEMKGYEVNVEDKTIGEEMGGYDQFTGIFSDFFKWTKN